MCDGVTQGQDGMELSLLSREVIAMSAAIGLSHNMFDGALYLGVCDKIVPGLAMAALSFGHLPSIFIPSGPMASGLANKEKVRIRQLYAEGKVDRMALLESEAASYHAPGTCTFYGTANTNQMVVEFMGMQLPGSSFVHPDAPLREALTAAAARQVTRLTGNGNEWMPLGKMFDEKVVVNGIVALLATGVPPTTPCTWWLWRGRQGSSLTGMISPISLTWCRCWRASTRTARRILTTSRRLAACRCWCASC